VINPSQVDHECVGSKGIRRAPWPWTSCRVAYTGADTGEISGFAGNLTSDRRSRVATLVEVLEVVGLVDMGGRRETSP
jgi:hypothetical protein